MIKVCVAGATGWVGKPLCEAIAKAGDMQLTGAVARSAAGQDLASMIPGAGITLTITGSVREALETAVDVLVDYTKADVVKKNVTTAIEKGVHVVIGSSGLIDADFEEIDTAAREKGVGVIAAGNFAITAVLLQRFACEAAKYLSQWELIDYASDKKPDAPSGTVRELAFRLSEVRKPGPTIPVEQTLGERGTRGATMSGIQVHSVRLPGYVIGVEAIFGAKDERLTLRHDAGAGADPYIAGTMLAIRKVGGLTGLVRGLDKVMDG
jgi:4-hydroxy-tetrahydrodipicolinate reductase